MHGILRARLERVGGRTEVTRQLSQHPLRLALPHRPHGSAAAVLYLGTVTGGIGASDRLEVALELGAGAEALATSQSATKLLSMPGGCASQRFAFSLADDAVLEYIPDELIPFTDSRFEQETEVRLASTASVILADLLTPGRSGLGEHFAFERLRSRLRIWRDERLLVQDAFELCPAAMGSDLGGLLGGYSHLGSLFVVTPRADAALADEIAEALLALPDVLGSASAGQGCVVVRLLAHSTREAKGALLLAWRIARSTALHRADARVPGKLLF